MTSPLPCDCGHQELRDVIAETLAIPLSMLQVADDVQFCAGPGGARAGAGRKRLLSPDVRQTIYRHWRTGTISQRDLADTYGVSLWVIETIIRDMKRMQ